MSLFRKKRERIPNEETAQKIAGAIMGRQKQLAGYLNRRTSHLSGKRLLVALILFCTVFGSYCLYLLICACK
jgi:hypothetical protein